MGFTCGDSKSGFVTDVFPDRVGRDTAVGTLVLVGHLQNLEHPIRKRNEPGAHRAKQRGGRVRKKANRRKKKKTLSKWLLQHETSSSSAL